MSKEKWIEAKERAQEKLDREPTEDEIRDELSAYDDHVYEEMKTGQLR